MNATAKVSPRYARPRPTAPVRAKLEVVKSPRPKKRQRLVLASSLVLIVAAIGAALGINSYQTVLSLNMGKYRTELEVLKEQNQALRDQINEVSSASKLADKARELGMVPYADYGYINLDTKEIVGGKPAR
ncbi:hypothetical protein BK816_05700 [Boudabousia tangfeifanii]|uniref:Cell division protein FtsL n=1 Tax=Boudabousia tangfeifanii TaxID=1912795 RepID=A0A1D9ML26_9ACTO|nr:hypothetical protein [Boudabousia tangfeifanii]AOZ72850.1 hypothetical protein BK816_05700 [Boudabousia tangfeifanii]